MAYNPDKLGFYRVGDFKTYSKFKAIAEHKKTGRNIVWDFNNQSLYRFNWLTTPKETLSELYLKRAKQLRKEYDYLVLFYSGGSDSQTVLNTFINNGIHVDEVATCCSLKGAGENGYFNQEVLKVAIPQMEQLKLHLPNTKFRVIDQTDMILSWFADHPDWYKHQNIALTPNCVTRARLRDLIPEYHRLEKDTNLGFVWGMEKPFVYLHENGRFFIQIFDGLDANNSAYGQEQGWKDEYFYLDPNNLRLISKQAHVIVDALKSNSIPEFLYTDQKTKYGKNPTTGRYLTDKGTSYLIYPTWNLNTFSNGKNPSMVYGARDTWFFENYRDTKSYANWANGVEAIREEYKANNGQRFLNSDDMFDGITCSKTFPIFITR